MTFDKRVVSLRFRQLRGKRTQREVAAGIGVSSNLYAMYERGERMPKDKDKPKIAEYFGLSIEDLFYSDEAIHTGG